jgi:cell division septal protein FtsQ
MSQFGALSQRNRLPVDYHQKKLQNPFFKRRKEKIISFAGLKTKLLLIVVILILALAVWFFLVSSFWKIKDISITGADQATGAEIRQLIVLQMKSRSALFFSQSNLLFFQDKKLQETLKNGYRFQKIDLEKKWPAKLVVKITEKPIACVWNEAEKYYYADTDGYIVQELNPLDIKDKLYPLITNQSGEIIYNSQINADPILLTIAAELFEKIPQKSFGLNIDRFIIDNEVDTIKIKTAEGPVISFDAKGDIDKQLDRLLALKTQKLKDDFAKKKTIDLRFGDKIYYQ